MQSPEAIKAHMVDKGHCKMLFEGEALLEYAQYYDYTSSYPDAENADPDEELLVSELPETLLDEGYELKLPSGKVIGHRALVRYYKQYLPNSSTKTNKGKVHKFLADKGLGTLPMKLEADKKRMRDIRYVQKVYKKYSTQLQFKQNKLQHHFRPQVNF